jgi:hypothetical protein
MKKVSVLFTLLAIAILFTACFAEQSQNSPLIGSKAPEFSLDNTLGGTTSLSDFDGTPVLLYFHMAVG